MSVEKAYRSPNFDRLSVRRAQSASDFEEVIALRKRGFGRGLTDEEIEALDWIDPTDRDDDSIVLLATLDSEAVATLRISSGIRADTGIAKYVPINGLLSDQERPYCQFARLSAPKHVRARDAMFALFKSAWKLSEYTDHNSIVLATPPWAIQTYQLLQFRDVGDKGEFLHSFGRPVKHRTMVLPIYDVYNFWRSASNPLCDLFLDTDHPNLLTRI